MRRALASAAAALAVLAAQACRTPGRDCRSTDDCVQNEICFPPGVPTSTTAPRPDAAACSAEGDCTANQVCRDGACAPKPCTADGDCQGACVEGACYDAPGHCDKPASR